MTYNINLFKATHACIVYETIFLTEFILSAQLSTFALHDCH